MLQLLKSTARFFMPRVYGRFRDRWRIDARLNRIIVGKQGLMIATGPFSGMKYIMDSHGSRLAPKLLGSYELELHETIVGIIKDNPSVIVDVGCAEGYYAVGFARALPKATVYAYDIDLSARAMCSELGILNGVEGNLVIQEKCDCKSLKALPLENALIMCDCEGYELELLCPDKVPALKDVHLLVELHDCFVPGVTTELKNRFNTTHHIRLIDIQKRDPDVYVSLNGLRPAMRKLALFERETDVTPPQQWAYMVPMEKNHGFQ